MHGLDFQNNVVEEAISQLIFGCGGMSPLKSPALQVLSITTDHMTSQTSTFPYSLEESKTFLDILLPTRERPVDGRILSLTARILSVISCNRYFTHYGQEQARLSRDSAILESEGAEPGWSSTAASAVTLKTQDFFLERLHTTFTDNYVYAVDWKKFMRQSLKKWQLAFMQSIALLALHIFAFFLPVSQPLATLSTGALGLSVASSALLINRYQDMEETTANDGHAYLSQNRRRFQQLSLTFAVPQALSLWGLFLMSAQVMSVLQQRRVLVLSASIVLVAIASICRNMFVKSRKPESDKSVA